MKRKRKASKRKPQPNFRVQLRGRGRLPIQRLLEEVLKSLREFLDELKRQRFASPPTRTIIIKLPNIGDDDGPGSPVPWRGAAWQPTCYPVSTHGTTTGANTGTVTHWHVKQ
jgi:hypothetical protein